MSLEQENMHTKVGVIETVIDIAFGVDILINFRTAYYNREGDLVFDRQKVIDHYLKGWLIIDILAAIPFHHEVIGIEHHPAVLTLRTLKYAIVQTTTLNPLNQLEYFAHDHGMGHLSHSVHATK